jgi:hypothetical protein
LSLCFLLHKEFAEQSFQVRCQQLRERQSSYHQDSHRIERRTTALPHSRYHRAVHGVLCPAGEPDKRQQHMRSQAQGASCALLERAVNAGRLARRGAALWCPPGPRPSRLSRDARRARSGAMQLLLGTIVSHRFKRCPVSCRSPCRPVTSCKSIVWPGQDGGWVPGRALPPSSVQILESTLYTDFHVANVLGP